MKKEKTIFYVEPTCSVWHLSVSTEILQSSPEPVKEGDDIIWD